MPAEELQGREANAWISYRSAPRRPTPAGGKPRYRPAPTARQAHRQTAGSAAEALALAEALPLGAGGPSAELPEEATKPAAATAAATNLARRRRICERSLSSGMGTS